MTEWWTKLIEDMREASDLRVAVYGSGGAPFHQAALFALWGGRPRALSADGIKRGELAEIDAIIFPGGGMRAMEGMLEPLGTDGAQALRQWVATGGMYIGSCAGSFLPACVGRGYWQAHREAEELYMVPASLANAGDSEWEGLTSPGVGIVEVAVVDASHWLVDGLPPSFRLVHYNGPMFNLDAPHPERVDGEQLTPPEGVVRFVAATEVFTPSEGFLSNTIPSPTLFERCVDRGAHSAITTRYGQGTVVLFGSHPEFGFDAMQLGWGEGARLLANAFRYQARRRGTVPAAEPGPGREHVSNDSLRVSLRQLAARLEQVARRQALLAKQPPDAWLEPGRTPAFMGRDPHTLWREVLQRSAEVSSHTGRYLRTLAERQGADLLAAYPWIDHEPPAGQDFGFAGLRQLVRMIEAFIDDGEQKIATEPFAMQHPYDGFFDHPFHLLVGSYLSAAGLTASAALSSAVIGAYAGVLDGVPVGPAPELQPVD